MNVIGSKEFNEVMEYMKEYFQHSKHYLFSNTIDTVTKSDGKKYNSLYCFYTNENKEDPTTILIFLNPNEEDCSNDNFITISYQDILEYVIEPLLSMEMNVNTKIILEDYIVNLGQPKKQIKENGKETGLESILAVSKKNKNTFSNLLKEYEDLLNASLVAYYKRKDELNNIFVDNLNTIRKDIKGNESLLYSFWETNKTLLRIYLYGKENEDGMIENRKKLFKIKASTRDNVKYIVRNNDDTLINETDSKGNIKTVPKSIASFYIFKAWAKQNPDATLDDIRKAFPVSECAKHYEKVFQYLFYEYNEHDKNARIIYTDDKEEFPERAYIEWDFYKGDLAEIYHLNLNGVKVMTQKFWSKRKVGDGISDDFKILADYAEEHYDIKVEEHTL